MEALKLTNSINLILNEDKFSKYTVQQIVDELGEDEFKNYLEKICTKIIRNLDTATEIKDAKPFTEFGSTQYEAETYGEPQHLLVEFIEIVRIINVLVCNYRCYQKGAFGRPDSKPFTDSVYIYSNDVDIINRLKIRINKLYNSGAAKRARQLGLGE